jgi:putative transposase
MPRVRRSDLPDGIFHLNARGVDGCAIFRDDLDRASFLRILAETVDRHHWRVLAFCLLGNHYHLIVEATATDAWPRPSSTSARTPSAQALS